MILPDGYSDVPAGKIASVVTHLQMTERLALPPDPSVAWTLRKVECPSSPGIAISTVVSARSGCGSRASGCRTTSLPRGCIRRWSIRMRWCLDGRDEGLGDLDLLEPG